MGKIRSFVSVPIKELPAIEEMVRKMSGIRGIKGVKAENLHLTLKFLGDVDEEHEIPGITTLLHKVAGRHRGFTVSFRGSGAFPDLQRMRVAWIGIRGEELERLAKDVLRTLPVREGEKPQKFRPHLTIGRVKFPEGIREARHLLERDRDTDFGVLDVNGFDLMKSVLTPNGPIYTVIQHFSFGEEGSG